MRDSCGSAAAAAATLRLVTRAPEPGAAAGRAEPAARPALIELMNVTKIFESGVHARGVVGPGRAAVAGLSLELAADSATLIEGPSGSGKTTLLSLIGCLVRPTAGRIQVAGREVSRLPEELLARMRQRRFGFVFQDHHLVRGLSAVDNVTLPALPLSGSGAGLRRRALGLLARFGLADRARERVERLSGGEQQRVAIARALINDPPIFIADEPTACLDPGTAGAVLELFAGLRDEGRTLVITSHDPLLRGSGFFDRRLEMRAGRLNGEGPLPCC